MNTMANCTTKNHAAGSAYTNLSFSNHTLGLLSSLSSKTGTDIQRLTSKRLSKMMKQAMPKFHFHGRALCRVRDSPINTQMPNNPGTIWLSKLMFMDELKNFVDRARSFVVTFPSLSNNLKFFASNN